MGGRRAAGVDGSIGTAHHEHSAAMQRQIGKRLPLARTEFKTEHRDEIAQAEQRRETGRAVTFNEQRPTPQPGCDRVRHRAAFGERCGADDKNAPHAIFERIGVSCRLLVDSRWQWNVDGYAIGEQRAGRHRVVAVQREAYVQRD